MGSCYTIWHRKFSSVLCRDLEGRDGGEGGREAQEGRDVCIHIVDSFNCTAESNTTLQSHYMPIKKKECIER